MKNRRQIASILIIICTVFALPILARTIKGASTSPAVHVTVSASPAINCSNALQFQNVSLYFFSHFLGFYTINFEPTLRAIANGQTTSGMPFFQKVWEGQCPEHFSSSQCWEFTVEPGPDNFSPDPMPLIKQYNDGKADRGPVRVITDHDKKMYVITVDHEVNFCGPYPMPVF